MNPELDQGSIEKIKNGDQEAFRELVALYQRRAYYFCLRMVSQPQEAEDLAQEAFVKVFTHMKTFRGSCSFQTWFYQILLNTCRSHLRHRYLLRRVFFQVPAFSEEDEESPLETQIADTSSDSDPFEAAANQELRKEIKQAVASLPLQQREIFTLKHFEGLKISEIALITGSAEGTVKAHLFRAVQTLQKRLARFKEKT